MSGQLYSANVRIAVVNALGALPTNGGYIGILNTTKLQITPAAPDNPQQISRQNGTVGQIKSQAFIPKPVDVQIDIDDLNDQRVLSWAFNGSASGITQSASTVTAQVIAAGALGDWVALGARNITSFVLKDSTGTTTYLLGTDYLVDTIAGYFMPLSGGGITANASLKWSGTVPALTGQRMSGATVTSQFLRVEADMISLVDNSRWFFKIPIYQAIANGGMDLLGTKMLIASMKGSPLIPPDGVTPSYSLDLYPSS